MDVQAMGMKGVFVFFFRFLCMNKSNRRMVYTFLFLIVVNKQTNKHL